MTRRDLDLEVLASFEIPDGAILTVDAETPGELPRPILAKSEPGEYVLVRIDDREDV